MIREESGSFVRSLEVFISIAGATWTGVQVALAIKGAIYWNLNHLSY